jgi:hypothetical protein
MNRLSKFLLAFPAFTLALAFMFAPAQAAPMASAQKNTTMKVDITINSPSIFWNYTFLSKDGYLGKPATVKVSWTVGDIPRGETSKIVATKGQTSGEVAISAPKDALVNIEAAVYDADGDKLGFISAQVPNNGQTEAISIAPPNFTEPKLVWGQ